MSDLNTIETILPKLAPHELRKVSSLCANLIRFSDAGAATRFKPKPSPLVDMRVGETIFLHRPLYHCDRVKARRELGDEDAQWTSRLQGNGKTRVVRVR